MIVSDFNIEQIAESGQCFRWNKISNMNYRGIINGKVCEVNQIGNKAPSKYALGLGAVVHEDAEDVNIKIKGQFTTYNAVSQSDAKGLMQIMDPTSKQMARKIDTIDDKNYDVFDPYTNIHMGAKYLSYLIKYFDGNYYLAIIAYNAGMGRVDTWLEAEYNEYTDYSKLLDNIQYDETKIYFEKVLNYYNIYTKLYN